LTSTRNPISLPDRPPVSILPPVKVEAVEEVEDVIRGEVGQAVEDHQDVTMLRVEAVLAAAMQGEETIALEDG
jgi:hypothetical protein